MKTLILDAALGTQLAVNGEELPDWKKSLWSAHALIYKPEAILKMSGGAVTDLYNNELIYGTINYAQGGLIIASNNKKNHKTICNELKEIIEELEISNLLL